MEKRKFLFMAVLLAMAIIAVQCKDDETFVQTPEMTLKKGKPTPTEEAGNNLSYPVIWSDGVAKSLPGTFEMVPKTEGEWWYWWGTEGTDPNIVPLSCSPDPVIPFTCVDGEEIVETGELVKAYLQKDPDNTWQAGSFDWKENIGDVLNVHLIDWGDNLESNDWYTRSQVRTEVVLFQDLNRVEWFAGQTPPLMLEYEMRHTSGWGIDEVHGLATDLSELPVPLLGPGTMATVYSHCARLTIQKLLVDREDERLAVLIWVPGEGWTEPGDYEDNLINEHIFNGSVHDGGDGPGYYSAEINVKGRIIYGYTWNVRQLNDLTVPPGNIPTAAGDYRITFSFDEVCGSANLNTFFVKGVEGVEGVDDTQILLPEEVVPDPEGTTIESDDGSAGGTAVIDFNNNLTYMDVRILERGGGGGKDK